MVEADAHYDAQTQTYMYLWWRSSCTSVPVLRAQVGAGYVLQLLGLAVVEPLDVSVLVVDHAHQTLDLRFQMDHLHLTWHRGLDGDRQTRMNEMPKTTNYKPCYNLQP